MTEFDISQDELKSLIHYDPMTGKFTWIADGREVSDKGRSGYCDVMINQRSYLLHRLAWLYMVGSLPTTPLDHIDGNPKNNKWLNLRACSWHENSCNQGLRKDSKTGFKGVRMYSNGRYAASISANHKRKHLGIFSSADAAAHAYNKAAIEMHGEFARLNPVGIAAIAAQAGEKSNGRV